MTMRSGDEQTPLRGTRTGDGRKMPVPVATPDLSTALSAEDPGRALDRAIRDDAVLWWSSEPKGRGFGVSGSDRVGQIIGSMIRAFRHSRGGTSIEPIRYGLRICFYEGRAYDSSVELHAQDGEVHLVLMRCVPQGRGEAIAKELFDEILGGPEVAEA